MQPSELCGGVALVAVYGSSFLLRAIMRRRAGQPVRCRHPDSAILRPEASTSVLPPTTAQGGRDTAGLESYNAGGTTKALCEKLAQKL